MHTMLYACAVAISMISLCLFLERTFFGPKVCRLLYRVYNVPIYFGSMTQGRVMIKQYNIIASKLYMGANLDDVKDMMGQVLDPRP